MNYDFLKRFPAITCRKNVSLAKVTTFALGGKCSYLICCQSPLDLKRAIGFLRDHNCSFIVIGEGSNLLVSDKGTDCVVVRFLSRQPIICYEKTAIDVSASTRLDDLALFASTNSLEGLNFTSGIPGTVGGAIVGNAGAFGKQISDCLLSVKVLNQDGKEKEMTKNALRFGYRDSIFKSSSDANFILSARFLLNPKEKKELDKERREILEERVNKHPDYKKIPCAGSFFKNIISDSSNKREAAGWFLDQVNGKEMTSGGAGVFKEHANILIKKNENCTAQDVFDLAGRLSSAVNKRFGISLAREVRYLGKFENTEESNTLLW